MKNIFLYRNIRARDQLDIFLISAITSLLMVRFYLEITDYPKVGGGGLHIAHMLWGGALMVAAITIALSFIGARSQQMVAILGGVGFGVFIDELGKFITHDNNYFFRPAVGIIYAIFVILYLTFNFLTRTQKLTSREYQLNALVQLEEAIDKNMDKKEKTHVYRLLHKADPSSPITKELLRFVDKVETTSSGKGGLFQRLVHKLDRLYEDFWQRRESHSIIRLVFLLEVLILAAGVVLTIYSNLNDITGLVHNQPTYELVLIIGQFLSSLAAASFALYGVSVLKNSRLLAFEQFRRATLINIYLTEFFVFSRFEFQALPGLIINLIILGFISFSIRQEHRIKV